MTITAVAERIREAREKSGKIFLEPAELIALCSKQELDELINAEEASTILSAVAGRHISPDYVKLLRLRERLPVAKQASKRAYLYRLRDTLFVTFNAKRKISVSDKIDGKTA